MFEKEAEEIANKRCHEIMCYGHCSFSSPKHHRCGEWHREYECALKGAEFGYNKANEWHYVKDGDLPKEDNRIMLCYCRKGYHGNIGIYVYRLFTKQEFMENKVIAWKEIVLPELKESE